jgi:hypothetical protein
MVTKLVAGVLSQLKLNVREIHSKKSQSAGTKVSDESRKSKLGLILVTSDVSARGVDYPDVTLVIQVGCAIFSPAIIKKEICIHGKFVCFCRLGCLLIENNIYIDLVGLDGKARKDKASYCWLLGKCIFLAALKIYQHQRLQQLQWIQAFKQQ